MSPGTNGSNGKPAGGAQGASTGRAYVPSLASPHPLGSFLPALYQEDEFAQAFTTGLDGVLAPIFNSLDNFEAYLDPSVAPEDFVDWLGTWMGLVVDETWPLERRRAFVAEASALYRKRGTPKGLAAHVKLFTDGEVEILERGGTAWSAQSGGKLPGSAGYDMLVRVRVDDPAQVDRTRLDALVAAAKPAHLSHRIEVLPSTPPPPDAPASPPPGPSAPRAPQPGPPTPTAPPAPPVAPAAPAGPSAGAPAHPSRPRQTREVRALPKEPPAPAPEPPKELPEKPGA
jgi:phage tail-like protein